MMKKPVFRMVGWFWCIFCWRPPCRSWCFNFCSQLLESRNGRNENRSPDNRVLL